MVLLKEKNVYSSLVHLGEHNDTILDRICAFLLALTPITQYYVGVLQDAAITTIACLLPWVLLRMIKNMFASGGVKDNHFRIILVLLVFQVYKVFIHEFSFQNLAFSMVVLIYYVAVAFGCINVKHYIKISGAVATLACILIIIQYFFQYILGIHIQFAPTALFTEEAHIWILGAKTGFGSITQRIGTLYRPSAFFMEPSHMFLYIFPHIFLLLFSPDMTKAKRNRALLYSVGILFSTSGMGILTVAMAWGLYLALSNGNKGELRLKNLFRGKNLLFVFGLIIFGVLLFIFVPFFRESIARFTDFSNSGAIAGRTRLASQLLKSLTGSQMVFGLTNTIEGITFNMSGFAATLYKFGIVGLVLSYSVYMYAVFKLKRQFFWIGLLVVIVSFFSAQTHGTFYMMYFTLILLEGSNSQRRKPVPKKIKAARR